MKRREVRQNQWDMAIAIKQGGDNYLENFQKYWKEHSENKNYLTAGGVNRVLTEYAFNVFNRDDLYTMKELIKTHFCYNDNLTVDVMNDIFLTAIVLMDMVEDDK